jgi:hypothetical protein
MSTTPTPERELTFSVTLLVTVQVPDQADAELAFDELSEVTINRDVTTSRGTLRFLEGVIANVVRVIDQEAA